MSAKWRLVPRGFGPSGNACFSHVLRSTTISVLSVEFHSVYTPAYTLLVTSPRQGLDNFRLSQYVTTFDCHNTWQLSIVTIGTYYSASLRFVITRAIPLDNFRLSQYLTTFDCHNRHLLQRFLTVRYYTSCSRPTTPTSQHNNFCA